MSIMDQITHKRACNDYRFFFASFFLTRKIASLNAVVKLKLIHFAERVRYSRHVTPVTRCTELRSYLLFTRR